MAQLLSRRWFGFWLLALLSLLVGSALADDRESIERKSQEALRKLRIHAPEADQLVSKASGVLVFPDMVEMGFGEGGRYGEGVLLVNQEPVAYYAATGGHHDLPKTEGLKAEVVLFMNQDALVSFRNTVNWKVGVSGGVTRVHVDGRGRIESKQAIGPVLGFTFSDRQLTPHLDLAGTVINRIAR
ncbi:twin-arginine translocation pathway signal [Parahaliea sp. F7430]|uniref:Twin-arginine translocation pathway signal n=1 Tax=Sediminihaliea albiluteola TaxID=2758564 RepID=A0A7W2YI43_9GAMM|nr:twin-arginine translocation pathway signal [Sediminihaliea albiluteola]MBA6411635.1 twin-arginine translocation pathway signal [Sediminihaliea albiluteola]